MSAFAMIESVHMRSPLAGVSDHLWERFVAALSIKDFGPNQGEWRGFAERLGGYGCFGIQTRRLIDLKIASGARVVRGKVVSAVFKPTKSAKTSAAAERAFLNSPADQRDALIVSISLYTRIHEALPSGMTRSGALALYHRLGPHAIEKWMTHKESSTVSLYERTNGLF